MVACFAVVLVENVVGLFAGSVGTLVVAEFVAGSVVGHFVAGSVGFVESEVGSVGRPVAGSVVGSAVGSAAGTVAAVLECSVVVAGSVVAVDWPAAVGKPEVAVGMAHC